MTQLATAIKALIFGSTVAFSTLSSAHQPTQEDCGGLSEWRPTFCKSIAASDCWERPPHTECRRRVEYAPSTFLPPHDPCVRRAPRAGAIVF